MSHNRPQFGVAGNPPNFWNSEFRKDRVNAVAWVRSIGLDAIELQSTRGVKMPPERAEQFRDAAIEHSVAITIHGPYYISLGTPDKPLLDNSKNELRKCVELCNRLGARGAVFHPGRIGAINRTESLKTAIKALREFERETDVGDAVIYPEIAGKVANLGSLDEILQICAEVDCCWPCLDLAHLHARTHGSLNRREDFEQVADKVQALLGREGLERCHFHFYPIEWGDLGEIKHRAFSDEMESDQLDLFADDAMTDRLYRPRFEPFIDMLVDRKLSPIVICEARDTQDVGALGMKEYWDSRSIRHAVTH